MSSQAITEEIVRSPITGPGAWRGKELMRGNEWLVPLTDGRPLAPAFDDRGGIVTTDSNVMTYSADELAGPVRTPGGPPRSASH